VVESPRPGPRPRPSRMSGAPTTGPLATDELGHGEVL
jgi:hypothetical protein